MTNPERFDIINEDSPRGGLWDPAIGDETLSTLSRTLEDAASQRQVRQSAQRILALSVSPTETRGHGTGLVIGYIQSGKTLSFTTVAALASDNQFGIVIVIAGMTKELANQSYERLIRDLGIGESPFGKWAVFFEPKVDDVARIRDVLMEAADPNVPPSDRRTVLIMLKKNHARLRSLNSVLRSLGNDVRVPVLVIDDEADQASLNTLVRNDKLSSTYRQLRDLRSLLPHHTFLQYTATPQAPLLINLIDVLSPEFCVLLEPGRDYVGGGTFFQSGTGYIATIPSSEIPTADHPLQEPPDSLLWALQLYFVGVASGLIRKADRPRNRSMLVHPSRETIGHLQYFRWVQAVRRLWLDILALPATHPDRCQLVSEFASAHADIAARVGDLEPLDQILEKLPNAILRTDVRLINSLAQAKRDVQWGQRYPWILVGGQVLDRGFTVEGLTVTYMPRGVGVGNADTIQQRARFFGYHEQYLGYCRVFLESAVADAYGKYVQHEEDVRSRLAEHIRAGRSLREFRRVFLLASSLEPTRRAVIDIDFTRPTFAHGWLTPSSPQDADQVHNRHVVNGFVDEHSDDFEADEGHPDRREHQRHRICSAIRLVDVYESLLTKIETRDFEDSQKWTAALIAIGHYLRSHPEANCTVYVMRPSVVSTIRQVRDGRIVNLFQGAYPDATGRIYPGDRQLRVPPVTVQLHEVTLREGAHAGSPIVASGVKVVTVWMASDVLQDVIVQPQGGVQ